MKTIQVVKRDGNVYKHEDVYVTKSCIPKLEAGEMYEIKGSDVYDGIYLASSTYDSMYASDVCKDCPFNQVPASGNNQWPYCSMYRLFKSGNSHSICITDARRYWPRLVIRKLSDIMESL